MLNPEQQRKLLITGVNLLEWLADYLSGKPQIVKMRNFISNEFKVTSEVPQDSHLEPISFNLFVIRLGFNNFLLYADNLKLYKVVPKERRNEADSKESIRILNAFESHIMQRRTSIKNFQLALTINKLVYEKVL